MFTAVISFIHLLKVFGCLLEIKHCLSSPPFSALNYFQRTIKNTELFLSFVDFDVFISKWSGRLRASLGAFCVFLFSNLSHGTDNFSFSSLRVLQWCTVIGNLCNWGGKSYLISWQFGWVGAVIGYGEMLRATWTKGENAVPRNHLLALCFKLPQKSPLSLTVNSKQKK